MGIDLPLFEGREALCLLRRLSCRFGHLMKVFDLSLQFWIASFDPFLLLGGQSGSHTVGRSKPRLCGQSSQPDGDCGDGYDGEEVSRGFFVAGCNASEVLEFAEAAFDEVAFFIDVLVERVFFGA